MVVSAETQAALCFHGSLLISTTRGGHENFLTNLDRCRPTIELDNVVHGILKVAFAPGACDLPDGVERLGHMRPTLASETGVTFVRPTEESDGENHEDCGGCRGDRDSD